MCDRTARIRELNDAFRTTLQGGKVMVTAGIAALGLPTQLEVLERVKTFQEFTSDNDPYGEHDFGSFDHEDERIFWKIDCYDRTLEYGSDDPSDPLVTVRVLTIMLASEY